MRIAAAALIAALGLGVGSAAAADRGTGVLVQYVRAGGFVGEYDKLVVYRDGRATAAGGAFRLSSRKLAAVRDALVRARFRTLERSYGPECCDMIGHSVTYAGRRVTVYEGATGVPLRLRRVLGLLQPILLAHR